MNRVIHGGILGRALDDNARGRLATFVTDAASPAISLFGTEHRAKNREGDWYGEHAGKWLYAAAKSAARTGDAALAANLKRVADFLVASQEPDGYLGTYAPERRFPVEQPPPQRTWDGAPSLRTWDIWIHAYLVLGLLEVHRHFPDAKYLEAARRIGDLCIQAIGDGGIDVTHLGNHFGMSASVLLDPAVELYFATGDGRYLALANRIVEQVEARPELQLVTRAAAGADASDIATGKAYQLSWNLVGLAKLFRATGEHRYLEAVRKVWENIRRHHLTLGGGPWGGVAHRSREVFNAPGAFSPYGYVETCSILSWLQLNRELSWNTGDARFAEEIERSAYNDLLGAQAPGGEDWCYYSFPNGKRVFTTYWRCCKSSGAMALEELPDLTYRVTGAEILVNLYGPSDATLAIPGVGGVRFVQETRYPFEGEVLLRVTPPMPVRMAVRVRIPSWAQGATVDGAFAAPGQYLTLDREWKPGDTVRLVFPMVPVLHRQSSRNVQESVAPDGAPVRQEVLRHDYAAITRGPLAYATGLIDGFKVEETVRLEGDGKLELLPPPPGHEGPGIRVNLQSRAPLTFVPYYEAGGRRDGAWRLTWLSLAPAGIP